MSSKTPHLLVIGYVWPEPASSAAGSRMLQLIDMFCNAGWHVTFASPAADSTYMADLALIRVNKVRILLNDPGFDAYVKQLDPTAVMFDRFMMEEQFGWRVAENCPAALRILDTEDLHCLRHARGVAAKAGRAFTETDLLGSAMAHREIASIYRCDCSLLISEYEMQLVKKLFRVDDHLVYYLPLLVKAPDATETSAWPGFEERRHFAFIGNFLHAPNADAVIYLHKEIWPGIREALPGAEVHIYGAYPPAKIQQLHKPATGFHIMGRAKDAATVLTQARVNLAPLRFGAGLKGKLIEGMLCGTPYVSTSAGAEGINGNLAHAGMVKDKVEDYTEAAIKLYTDKDAWTTAQQNGINIIHERFQRKAFEPAFMHHIQHLTGKLGSNRQRNFTGAMLMHHRVHSTRYLAKWIEAKNRPRDAE